MTCPITGAPTCHCNCPGIIDTIANKHNLMYNGATATQKEHFKCMAQKMSCDDVHNDHKFKKVHEACTSQGIGYQ